MHLFVVLPSLMAVFQIYRYLMFLNLHSLDHGILKKSEHFFLKSSFHTLTVTWKN